MPFVRVNDAWPPRAPRPATWLPRPPRRSRRRDGPRRPVVRRSRAGLRSRTRTCAGAAPIPRARDGTHPAPRPVHLVGLPLTAHQPFLGDPFLGRDAQRREVAVGQEDQPSPRSQEPGGLWQPALGVTPGSRSVLAHHQVEASPLQRNTLRIRLDQREDRPDSVAVFGRWPAVRRRGRRPRVAPARASHAEK